jgi:glutamate racemase
MANNKAIGIFDSGVGGLTVASAIHALLPQESFIYFGDTRHAPYGDKSQATILDYSRRISKFLVEQDCKAIVIACNSASAAAYTSLLQEFPSVPILNVIDPIVTEISRMGGPKLGVIATRATTRSNVYAERIQAHRPALEVIQKATPLLASLVEEGFAGSPVSKGVIEHYLKDPSFENLSHLVLGCTHYPLLQNDIEEYLGPKVQVLNSADLVAQHLKELLEAQSLLKDGFSSAELKFYVSEKTAAFSATAKLFFGQEINLQERLLPA